MTDAKTPKPQSGASSGQPAKRRTLPKLKNMISNPADNSLLSSLLTSIRSLYSGKKGRNSIVPERSVASQTLMIVVAIMSFLTCLTFAMVTIVWQQASAWQSDIAQEVTVQVRPVDGADFETEIRKALRISEDTPGIANVQVVDDEWSERLLQPWLGNEFDLSELPVPRMLVLELDQGRRANLRGLAERLSDNVQGASLNDHRLWLDRLNSMANTTVAVGLTIMGLMLTAMTLSVTFATHGAMTSNKEVIEVLHFVGGRDTFIATEFQRRFMALGLKGGVAGGGVAILCFIALNFWGKLSVGTPQADQISALFGSFQIGWPAFLGTLFLVIIIALLTAITCRFAVIRYLTKMT